MAGRGPEQRRVFVPQGGEVRVVLEGGTILDIKNPGVASYVLEQRPFGTRETQREELRAQYADILYPHVRARLNQHGYQVLGGEEVSGEMALMETTEALHHWLEKAKTAGISNGDIRTQTKELLKQVTIAAPRSGEISALVKGINTEITGMVDEVWGVKRPGRTR